MKFKFNVTSIIDQLDKKEDETELFSLVEKAKAIAGLPIAEALQSSTSDELRQFCEIIGRELDSERRHDNEMTLRKFKEVIYNSNSVRKFVGLF